MEEIDYEDDVNQLKRVWQQMKHPNHPHSKKNDSKNESSTQAKTHCDSKIMKKEKKVKVIVSDQNLRRTFKSHNHQDVIEVTTHPQQTHADPIKAQSNNMTPQKLLLSNPEQPNLINFQQLKLTLAERDHELSLLRVQNSRNQDRICQLEAAIDEKEKQIDELRGRERVLTTQLSALASKDSNFAYGKVQYENYRQDSRRLLKILKTTAEYRHFADLALQDDGVRFLSNASKQAKTQLDAPAQPPLHFCSCNKAFIAEPNLWVPEKVYDMARNFLRERKGELSESELQLLLYELNKIWREREKRLINQVSIKTSHPSKQQKKESNHGKLKILQGEQ